MNKLVSILITIFISISTFGQDLNGVYKNQKDSLSFSYNKVIFSLSDFSALSSQVVGEGTFQIINNYLIIDTGEYSGDKTRFKTQNSEKQEESIINIVGTSGYVFPGVLVEFLSSSNKIIDRAITDENGKATQPINEKIKTIRVSNMGYNAIEIESKTGIDYSIVLAKNNVIQNQTLVLEIKEYNNDYIIVRLLSEDFKPGKSPEKALGKLLKIADKRNILSKRLTKEYVSQFYKQ